jgi:heat shock protein HtpX
LDDRVTSALDDRVTANKRRATLLAVGLAGGLAVVLFVMSLVAMPPFAGLLLALGAAAALIAVIVVKSTDVALWMIGAQPASPVEHARLHNLVESLCFSSGLPKPALYVVDDASVNAFAAGRSPRHAAIGVTSGLLESFTRIELEAVLGHELSRVKSYDVLVSTLAVTMIGLPASILPDNLSARLLTGAIGASEDFAADIGGVSLTRYPPGLISALEKLRDGEPHVQVRSGAAGHLWLRLFGPAVEAGQGGAEGGSLDARIEALSEL